MPVPKIETYFLDTNVLVKLCEYFRLKSGGGDAEKFGLHYDFVQQLLEKGYKVIISRISILEMHFLYHRWFYWGKKVAERASFNEMFGKDATYELEDNERQRIEAIMSEFIEKAGQLGIEFSKVDQSDVLRLAEILYRRAKPSVEPYDLEIYANAILESAQYLVTTDGPLRRAIDYFRKNYQEQIRNEIIASFGEGKYPYWGKRYNLPKARRPR
ncbi:MAG: hypothetical protein DDT31_01049 [Syntrophomonadaceae bacterium]|nr:hypothetical protein [Bacillota bacterium]MBT9138484.1 hypothetical protein [Bacillota bacterium]